MNKKIQKLRGATEALLQISQSDYSHTLVSDISEEDWDKWDATDEVALVGQLKTDKQNKYKQICFNEKDIDSFIILSQFPIELFEIINMDFKHMSKHEYHQWILEWKKHYNDVADIIRLVKRNKSTYKNFDGLEITDKLIHELRKLANTLLNARQKSKDVYRNKIKYRKRY